MIKKVVFLILILFPTSLFSQNIDISILRELNSPETQSTDKIFKFLSNSIDGVIIGAPLALGITGLIEHNDPLLRKSCMIAGADLINLSATMIIKYIVNRERPYDRYPDITKKSAGGSPSFPSGHASSSFATATAFSLALPKWYVIAPSYLWAGAVSYSRMHLGVHYPSDVLAGAIVGTGSAFLSYKANKWLTKHYEKKHEPKEGN